MYYSDARALEILSPRRKQSCPLCGESQTIMMRGKTADIEDGAYEVVGDRGYSFCNCRNIFFTDWSNINLNIYDDDYRDRHSGDKNDQKVHALEIEKQWNYVQRYHKTAKSFLNVGDYDDALLDYLKKQDWNGMELTTIDIIQRESKHNFLRGNFEGYNFGKKKFDIVWMSHFIEHTKDPVLTLKKAASLLNTNGIIFNAMPDTHHIDFSNPLAWCFCVAEHHTLWNMYDFISMAKEECGLKCIYQNISYDVINKKYSNRDDSWYWIEESRTIFQASE